VQLNSTKALQAVLREKLSDGCAIFQGRRHALLQEYLTKRAGAIRPFFVDLQEHNAVLEYRQEDQVISVETGITIGALEKILQPNHQYFPSVQNKETTLLEAINYGDRGYLEHSYSLRSMVLGLEVLLATGDTIRTGGKVVKNVTGYDLTKLFIGARGTLGIPVKAHLRAFATPEQNLTYKIFGGEFGTLIDLASDLIKSGLPFTGIEAILGSEEPDSHDFLLVNIAEHTQVVSELVPQLEMYASNYKLDFKKVAESDFGDCAALFQVLEDEFPLDTCALSVSCSRSQSRAIVALLGPAASQSMRCLHYRPGVGRLRLKFASPEKRQSAMELLRQHCLETSVELSIACADADYEYRIDRLPENDLELLKLKQGIKQRFDPDNVMNPLARL
jgi:glycolate oxidase FAD binding subunit